MSNRIVEKITFSNRLNNYLFMSGCFSLLSSVEVSLTTHCLLKGSGISAVDTAHTAIYSYIGKDVVGQIGGLAIVGRISKKIDSNPKKYVNIVFAIYQSSILLELSTLFVSSPLLYLTVGSISNIGKNIGWIGFGSINAKCIQLESVTSGNESKEGSGVAEVYSKIAIVNSVSSSVGLSIGMGIIYLFDLYSISYLLPVVSVPISIAKYLIYKRMMRIYFDSM